MALRSAAAWLLLSLVAVPAAFTVSVAQVYAQDADNGDNGDNGDSDDGDDDGDNDNGGNLPAGVMVDAEGTLRMRQLREKAGGKLSRQRAEAAKAALGAKGAVSSPIRKVSLNRLERAIRENAAAGGKLTDEMKCLAGLTRVQYVFYYPETTDIVLAGPAEACAKDSWGRVRGIESGSPTVLLEDLAVALRAFPPDAKGTPVISCSIDPTKEGLANMQQFLRNIGSRATPGDTQFIITGLRQSLGPQKVSVTGVPATTHFAQVLVEADYRMKLIGIGLESPGVKLASYVDRASPAMVSRNALQRWFFIPDYESVTISDDKLAMQLVGVGVKLIGADELVTGDGNRKAAAKTSKASRQFTEGFTRKFPEIAEQSPVFAQLRNVIDLSMVAAYIQSQDLYSKADWKLGALADEKAVPTETMPAPQRVESAVASVWKGNRLMTPIGGGVKIQPKKALTKESVAPDSSGRVGELRQQSQLDGLAAGKWWWD